MLHVRRRAPVLAVSSVLAVAAAVRWALWDRLHFLTTEKYVAQIIPLELLREDPVRSIWNFHSQPPLFNLFVAGIMHAFPAHEVEALRAAMVGLGLLSFALLTLALLAVTRRPLASALLAAAVAVLPSTLAYEQWLFYAQLELACTAALALVFARAGDDSDLRSYAALGAVGLVMTLVRSAYHPLWLIVLLAGWAGTRRWMARRVAPQTGQPRTRLALAAAFSLLALAWPAKNALQFGFFGNSSWLGMSLAKIAVYPQPYEKRLALVNAGHLSHYALSAPFLPIDAYDPPARTVPPSHPVLGLPLNDERYVEVSEQLRHDAVWVIEHDPASYLQTVWAAAMRFFEPSAEFSAFTRANMDALASYDAPFRALLYPGGHLALSVVSYLFPLITGLALWLSALRGRVARRAGVQGFLLGATLAYALAVFCLTEWGENNRFRYTLLPLVTLGDAWAAVQLARLLRARRAG